jgi:hypothetical protein
MAWKLARCSWRDPQLNEYLAAGWDPFAVTDTEGEAIIWLRRSAEPADAGVTDLPRRPRNEPEVPAPGNGGG